MISLQAVTVRLPAGKPDARTILEDVSFTVHAGEKIAVAGRNGSGKTTLLQTIAGLICPCAGTVTVRKAASAGGGSSPSTALLLQEADNQFVASSVRNELLLGLDGAASRNPDATRRMEAAAERFRLTELLDRNPHRLSGGEKQRLAFATIWMSAPDILLLDEPTTYLDAPSRNRCYEFVNMLSGDHCAIVWATPGGEDLLRVDKILWLDDGEIRFSGSLRDLLVTIPPSERPSIVLPPLSVLSSRLARELPEMGTGGAVFERDGTPASSAAAAARVRALAERVLECLGGEDLPGADRAGWNDTESERMDGAGPSSQAEGKVIVALHGASYSYGSGDAVRDVTMEIRQGRCVGVTGLNGSGKSTLLSLLSGALQPTAGTVVRMYDRPFEAGAQNVFHLFQSPERMFFAETVGEELAFGLRHVHGRKARLDDLIRRALEEAGLEPAVVMDRSPLNLSFGEMRRLAFAVFLSLRPGFVLLDEPAACLDDAGTRLLRGIVDRFVADGGTVMIAAHDADFLFEACDRLIYLQEGRIVRDVDISSKFLPLDFEWPEEPLTLILALQEEMARQGLDVSPRAATLDGLLSRLRR